MGVMGGAFAFQWTEMYYDFLEQLSDNIEFMNHLSHNTYPIVNVGPSGTVPPPLFGISEPNLATCKEFLNPSSICGRWKFFKSGV